MGSTKYITIKTSHKAKKLLRQICAETSEKQFEVLERLLKPEYERVKKA